MVQHNPWSAAEEIREQLASEKRKLAFFFGAGTSMAVGLPGINELTKKVSEQLEEPYKTKFKEIQCKLAPNSNVEQVLDRIRTLRDLIGDSETSEYDGLKGASAARALDSATCQTIRTVVQVTPPKGFKPHLIFAQWLWLLHNNRYYPVEIFTTNYDLLLEQAMEQAEVPFFDGFVGSINPFFAHLSVEAEEGKANEAVFPPKAWTRLWKLHGSINWRMRKNIVGKGRISRFMGESISPEEELVIFPSREKYIQSKKLPFVAFQDRLRKFLANGECLIIIVGYSFSDEHINDLLLQGLSSNPRLAAIVLAYGEKNNEDTTTPPFRLSEKIIEYGKSYKNLTIYGHDKACVGGSLAAWGEPSRMRKETEVWPFWDEEHERFTLGDFNFFTSFLEVFIGHRSTTLLSQQNILPSTETKTS
jgi:hypothetical protein